MSVSAAAGNDALDSDDYGVESEGGHWETDDLRPATARTARSQRRPWSPHLQYSSYTSVLGKVSLEHLLLSRHPSQRAPPLVPIGFRV